MRLLSVLPGGGRVKSLDATGIGLPAGLSTWGSGGLLAGANGRS